MSMLTNRFLSLISNLLKSTGQVFIFLILAKYLPASEFGEFSLYLSIAGIFALVGDYGCSTFALPLLSEADSKVHVKFVDIFWFRFSTLSISVIIGGTFAVAFASVDTTLFAICCGIVFISSLTDFCLLPFRAVQAFSEEAFASTLNALIYISIVSIVVITTKDIIYVSSAYLASRFFSLAAVTIIWKYYRHRGGIVKQRGGEKSLFFLQKLNYGLPYLTDSILSSIINYIDTILIGTLIGVEAVAQYQIPAKIMQMSLIVVQICVAIYVPTLVREKDKYEEKKIQKRMIFELIIVGGVIALGISFVAPLLVDKFFRSEYQLPEEAWFGFALALWLRLSAAGYGIVLIYKKQPKLRVIGQLLVLATFITGMLASARQCGLVGVSLSFSAAMLASLLFYRYSVHKIRRV